MKMIVQATNTGGDLSANHFDLQMPGGGFGIYNGCAWNNGEPVNGDAQFDIPYSNWGNRYGGVWSRDMCSGLPSVLQAGCQWRWDSFNAGDNPSGMYRRV